MVLWEQRFRFQSRVNRFRHGPIIGGRWRRFHMGHQMGELLIASFAEMHLITRPQHVALGPETSFNVIGGVNLQGDFEVDLPQFATSRVPGVHRTAAPKPVARPGPWALLAARMGPSHWRWLRGAGSHRLQSLQHTADAPLCLLAGDRLQTASPSDQPIGERPACAATMALLVPGR
jgi:hypothetical protein